MYRGSQVVLKNPPADEADKRCWFDPWGRKIPEGHDNSLQYSCLENPMDRGAWRAIVHSVAKSRTQLKWLSMQHARPIRWREEEVGGNLRGQELCRGPGKARVNTEKKFKEGWGEVPEGKWERHLRDVSPTYSSYKLCWQHTSPF